MSHLRFIKAKAEEIYIVRLEPGEKIPETLIRLADSEKTQFLIFYGLGGFRRARIGFFKEASGYEIVEIRSGENRAVEVASIIGSVIWNGERYHPHIHVVLGLTYSGDVRETYSYAGHLIEAEIYPLMELFMMKVSGINIDILKDLMPHRFR